MFVLIRTTIIPATIHWEAETQVQSKKVFLSETRLSLEGKVVTSELKKIAGASLSTTLLQKGDWFTF